MKLEKKMKQKINDSPLKSKYFKLTHFDFTKKNVEECVKDLKRFLKIFEGKLK